MLAAATASLRFAARRGALASSSSSVSRRTTLRGLATAVPTYAEAVNATMSNPSAARTGQLGVNVGNLEATWALYSEAEQATIHEHLEVLQQKDWKELTLDEKKAAYYVAFGPHGPRAPDSQPGDGMKIFLSVSALVGSAGLLTLIIHQFNNPPPKTISKEWEEAANERALEMKLNPITGISSDGYNGKGFVVSK